MAELGDMYMYQRSGRNPIDKMMGWYVQLVIRNGQMLVQKAEIWLVNYSTAHTHIHTHSHSIGNLWEGDGGGGDTTYLIVV